MGIDTVIIDGETLLEVTCVNRASRAKVKGTMTRRFPSDQRAAAEGFFIFNGDIATHRFEFSALSFDGFAAAFLLLKHKLRPNTLNQYADDLRPASAAFGTKRIDEVSKQDLRQLHLWGQAQKEWSESRLHNSITLRVGQVTAFARAKKAILIDPMKEARNSFRPYTAAHNVAIIPEQVKMDLLERIADPLESLVLWLAADLGLGQEEMDALDYKDCDLANAEVFVRHAVYDGDDPNYPVGRRLKITERVMIAMALVRSEARQAGQPASTKVVPSTNPRSILIRLQQRAGMLHETDKMKWAGKSIPAVRYDLADFNHVAARRYIREGKRTKQLSILMNLTIPIIVLHYSDLLGQAKGPDSLEATYRASRIVTEKIALLGLGDLVQPAQVPTSMEMRG